MTDPRQPNLLGLPAPAVLSSPTSVAAARAIKPSANKMRARVLAFLQRCGPSTDEQMQERIPMAASTQRPRRGELVRDGKVRDTGRKAKTRSGRNATLWEAM